MPFTPAQALDDTERERVLDELASPRFADRSPAEAVATLLDEGQYLCSERTKDRIPAAEQPVRERRNQLTHPRQTGPELVATAPNQTWSWDITRLLGATRWTYFCLYVLPDTFSRDVVGWIVAERNSCNPLAALQCEDGLIQCEQCRSTGFIGYVSFALDFATFVARHSLGQLSTVGSNKVPHVCAEFVDPPQAPFVSLVGVSQEPCHGTMRVSHRPLTHFSGFINGFVPMGIAKGGDDAEDIVCGTGDHEQLMKLLTLLAIRRRGKCAASYKHDFR